MGRIIDLDLKRAARDPIAQKLVAFSTEIDKIIVSYLYFSDIEAKELAGVLAHRLGSLLNTLERKEELWEVCEQVLKKQAQLD